MTSPPFGILDKDNKPTGSEIETARQLAKDLGVELELVQVTGPQRIPALLVGPRRPRDLVAFDHHGSGEIRLVLQPARCAQHRHRGRQERQHQERRRPRRQEDPHDARDARGASRAQGRASRHQHRVLRRTSRRPSQALLSGQVDAIGGAAFLINELAKRNPDKGIESKFTVRPPSTGSRCKPGNFDLLQWVNTWVFVNKNNGVLAKIYEEAHGVKLVDLPPL